MATHREEMGEIYQRLGALERHQTRVETEMPELKKTLNELDNWRVEMKVLVARWLGIYGAVAVIGQFVITILIQMWLSQHGK